MAANTSQDVGRSCLGHTAIRTRFHKSKVRSLLEPEYNLPRREQITLPQSPHYVHGWSIKTLPLDERGNYRLTLAWHSRSASDQSTLPPGVSEWVLSYLHPPHAVEPSKSIFILTTACRKTGTGQFPSHYSCAGPASQRN
ncbi:hypothetical protein TNCV_4958111 [Trichonephila clavipes]|nr:hypothetical protein TNCV_4958111 [Trichonephila clavipes]